MREAMATDKSIRGMEKDAREHVCDDDDDDDSVNFSLWKSVIIATGLDSVTYRC